MYTQGRIGLGPLVVWLAACSGGVPEGTVPVTGATTAPTLPASSGVPAPVSAPPTATTAASASASASATSAGGAAAGGSEPGDARALEPHTGPLATFHDALGELAAGRRHEHVRVTWLGDSHAQADFWTGTLREVLQRRFGTGGPGFVHLGFKGYRHGGTRVDTHGSWRWRHKKPSTTEPSGDGVFGLGGLLTAGYADEPWASVELTDPALEGKRVRWELCHKWGDPRGEFLLEHGPVGSPERRKLQAGARLGSLEHLSLETQGLGLLRVRVTDVHAEFCGVVVETDPKLHPGVVVDNLGLNGGRYATALSWDPTGWKKELARRPPDLAVIEYGGNEAGDPNFRPAAYKRNLLSVVARVREVRPEVSCLVIGLTERNDAEDRIVPVRDVQREAAAEVGCLFWDSYEQMGGKGSMRVWQADGRGADDGVHLKPKGYEELGQRLAADLLATYHGP